MTCLAVTFTALYNKAKWKHAFLNSMKLVIPLIHYTGKLTQFTPKMSKSGTMFAFIFSLN